MRLPAQLSRRGSAGRFPTVRSVGTKYQLGAQSYVARAIPGPHRPRHDLRPGPSVMDDDALGSFPPGWLLRIAGRLCCVKAIACICYVRLDTTGSCFWFFFFPTLFLSPPSFSILFSFGCLSCIAVHRPLLSTHSHARSPCPHGTSHFGDWDLRPLQNMLDLIPVRRSFRTRCLAAGHQISASKHESAPSVAQNGSFRLPESSRPQGKANMGQEWQCAWASQLAGSLVLCRTSANLVSPSVKVSQ